MRFVLKKTHHCGAVCHKDNLLQWSYSKLYADWILLCIIYKHAGHKKMILMSMSQILRLKYQS